MRAATYARFSSDNQSDASIADQERVCHAMAERLGHEVVRRFSDRAMSGSSTFRPGYQEMRAAAQRGEFDVLLAEALDRLSRDQEDTAALYKAMSFAGVKIVTQAENEINEMHVGLKGTMNALFLKDLAQKTHRGMRGRAEAGKSAGGICYGYRVVHHLAANGEVSRGDRRIDPVEARVVQRIFQMFADGDSPITIAKTLNAEGIYGPQGHAWRDTTIRGHALRGTGILRNELYVGRQIWNRMRFVKDPSTGKRVSRMNPPQAWVTQDVPELRIIDDSLWNQVQTRLTTIRENSGANAPDRNRFWDKRRAQHLLTGKIFCGSCGGAFASVGKDSLACGAARKQGTCSNRTGIRRSVIDSLILDALRDRLMAPNDAAAFVAEFTVEWNRLQADTAAASTAKERELAAVNRKLGELIDAISEGLRASSLQQKLDDLEHRKATLEAELREATAPAPRLHPNLAEIYRQKLSNLEATLHGSGDGTAALEAIRGLIDRVEMHPSPEGKGLQIELIGEIASMVALGLGAPRTPNSAFDRGLFARSVKVVAGTRNHRQLIPVCVAC